MVEFMSSYELARVEESIKQSKEMIAFGKSLDRLLNNPDFKKVILEDYMQNEAVRLVKIKADPGMQSVDSQKNILTQIDAIGTLAQYFQTLKFKVSQAEKALEIDEQTRDEIIEEGLN